MGPTIIGGEHCRTQPTLWGRDDTDKVAARRASLEAFTSGDCMDVRAPYDASTHSLPLPLDGKIMDPILLVGK